MKLTDTHLVLLSASPTYDITAPLPLCAHLIAYRQVHPFDLSHYAKARGSPQLSHSVSRKYARGTNYNTQRIITTLSLFDPDWGRAFETELDKDDLKERIDSICAVRNAVAHGDLPNISRPSLNGYFEAQVKAISLIKDIVFN